MHGDDRMRRCICKICAIMFLHENKTNYCMQHKKEGLMAKGGKGTTRKKRRQIFVKCLHCGVNFSAYMSAERKFCSYQCFLNSGGALRAGKAASTMTRKYGAKKDANHGLIVAEFKKRDADVIDLSSMGHGVPDLVVGFDRVWYLVDVKNPETGYGRRGLNQRQKEWADNWKGG